MKSLHLNVSRLLRALGTSAKNQKRVRGLNYGRISHHSLEADQFALACFTCRRQGGQPHESRLAFTFMHDVMELFGK